MNKIFVRVIQFAEHVCPDHLGLMCSECREKLIDKRPENVEIQKLRRLASYEPVC